MLCFSLLQDISLANYCSKYNELTHERAEGEFQNNPSTLNDKNGAHI